MTARRPRATRREAEAGRLAKRFGHDKRDKAASPRVTALNGTARPVSYDAATQHFTVEVQPDSASPIDNSAGDPVRRVTVTLEMPGEARELHAHR